jgi:hypothetical protein
VQLSDQRLAWIMGSSRSGSTWLLRMLCELDPVVGIDDPHLGHHLGVWRPLPLAWAATSEPVELTTLDRLLHEEDDYFFSERYRDSWAPALRRLILDRFAAQAARERPGEPDPLVVAKEPGCQAAELLFELLPASKLIFLLRDGRDVVDSWLDGYRPGSWAIDRGAFPSTPEGRVALAGWLGAVWSYRTRAVAQVYGTLPANRRVLVRYEELLSDTPAQLQRICSLLEIDATPSRLAELADGLAYDRVAPAERGPLEAVRSARPGGWRRRPVAERTAMENEMGNELAAWGYLPEAARRAA